MNTRNLTISILIILLLHINYVVGISQTQKTNPLRPYAGEFTEVNLGLMVSGGQNIEFGKYFVECPDCEFEGGVGSGAMLGLYYQRGINDEFHYGLMAMVDWWNLNSSFYRTEFKYANDVNTNQKIGPLDIEFLHDSDVELVTFSFAPYLKYQVGNWFFLRSSFPISFPISSSLTHNKSLISRVAVFNDETYNLEQLDESLLQDTEFPELNSPLYSLAMTMGFNIEMSERFSLNPSFYYRIGLNEVSSYGENFKINSWRIMLEFNVAIAKKPKKDRK